MNTKSPSVEGTNEQRPREARWVWRLVRAWHLQRARTLARKLEVQTKRCDMLEKSDREYRNSYYTDQFREAACERINIASAKKYHEDRAATP